MFLLNDYSQWRDDYDSTMPGGKAIDAPTGDSIAGTQYDQRFFNQVFGFFQAVLMAAYGEIIVSGHPDNAIQSDILDALKFLFFPVMDGLQEQITKNKNDLAAEEITRYNEDALLWNMIQNNSARITILENAVYNDVQANPFEVGFSDLDGIILENGIYNAEFERLECTDTEDMIKTDFMSMDNILIISGIYNPDLQRLEC